MPHVVLCFPRLASPWLVMENADLHFILSVLRGSWTVLLFCIFTVLELLQQEKWGALWTAWVTPHHGRTCTGDKPGDFRQNTNEGASILMVACFHYFLLRKQVRVFFHLRPGYKAVSKNSFIAGHRVLQTYKLSMP